MVRSIPALSSPAAPLRHAPQSECPLRLTPSFSTYRWRCSSSRKGEASFTDRILDYIEGGPKLRKWYGAPELLPQDGGEGIRKGEEESEVEEEDRDAVLVTNGDTEIGQMVILSLILKRVRIKAIVKDKRATTDAFSTYVEILEQIQNHLQRLLEVYAQLYAHQMGSGGFQAILNSKLTKLAEKDEEAVIASGIPYTIIRTGLLQDSPGGENGLSFKEGVAATGKISKEDAAKICVEALDVIPQKGLVFEVASGNEKILDWKELLTTFIRNEDQL